MDALAAKLLNINGAWRRFNDYPIGEKSQQE